MVDLGNLSSVRYTIAFHELDMYSTRNENHQHAHSEYEIYVNLSGAVSFMCGDNIYPVGPGNIVISRPGEPHHCIYNRDIPHRFYWMLFSCSADEPLLSVFHDRPVGVGNLITLTEEQTVELTQICRSLLPENCGGGLQAGYYFTRLLMLLSSGTAGRRARIPTGIQAALTYISANVSGNICVKELAEQSHMSLSTFERHFRTYVGMTPKQYIQQRKLVLAAQLLAGGCGVGEAFEACGFADYSHFISLFGKRFGMTPLNYRRAHELKMDNG